MKTTVVILLAYCRSLLTIGAAKAGAGVRQAVAVTGTAFMQAAAQAAFRAVAATGAALIAHPMPSPYPNSK